MEITNWEDFDFTRVSGYQLKRIANLFAREFVSELKREIDFDRLDKNFVSLGNHILDYIDSKKVADE